MFELDSYDCSTFLEVSPSITTNSSPSLAFSKLLCNSPIVLIGSTYTQDSMTINLLSQNSKKKQNQPLSNLFPTAWFTPMLPSNATPRRRQEFRLGRLCAAKALWLLGHLGSVNVPIASNRTPVWPTGFTGSIAHSSGLVLCAVGSQHRGKHRGIGLDIEALHSPLPTFSALLEHVCRESVYKALFPVSKQVFQPTAYQIAPLSTVSATTDSGIARATLTQTLTPALPQGSHLLVRWIKTSTHIAALCYWP